MREINQTCFITCTRNKIAEKIEVYGSYDIIVERKNVLIVFYLKPISF